MDDKQMCTQKTIDGINNGKLVAVPMWIGLFRYINPVAMISLIFYLGVAKNDIESRIFNTAKQKEDVLHHIDDHSLHMPYMEKVKVFVPRTEVEYKLEDMNKNIEKIMKKLNVN